MPSGSVLSVYHASVLHSSAPFSAANGRGDCTWTTRPGRRPSTISVTVLRSVDSVAEVTTRVSSSIFGPPYCGVGTYRHCSATYLAARSWAVSSDSGWVYSSSKPPSTARMARMSNPSVPLRDSFWRPNLSLPVCPQFPSDPMPPV